MQHIAVSVYFNLFWKIHLFSSTLFYAPFELKFFKNKFNFSHIRGTNVADVHPGYRAGSGRQGADLYLHKKLPKSKIISLANEIIHSDYVFLVVYFNKGVFQIENHALNDLLNKLHSYLQSSRVKKGDPQADPAFLNAPGKQNPAHLSQQRPASK